MRISPPPNSTRRDTGFTLVEMMVTLAVIGLLASAVMLAAPGADTRLHSEIDRLAARLKLASDQSVLMNRQIALVAAPEGYHFERREEDGWIRMDTPAPLGFQPWPGKAPPRIEAPTTTEEDGETSRLAEFDPLGGASAMRLIFGESGLAWRVAIDEAGEIRVDRAG